MDDAGLYDRDILIWAERQAALLRELAAARRDLPNELDLLNVAEEVEAVGRSELQAVESFAELIFVHLLRLLSDPASPACRRWTEEVRHYQSRLRRAFTPSMRGRINLDVIWHHAVHEATRSLGDYGAVLPDTLPLQCPCGLDDLLSDEFSPAAVLASLRALCQGDQPAS